jgi:16S rRNA (guanine(966)-N(2))-methyltransferase RsmD
MRVIAGRFRSRRLKSVPGLSVRPTPDRLREALFNVLAPRLPGTMFLDAYAGSGAVGIEALSRGAKHAVLIERNAKTVAVLRENVSMLGLEDEATVVRGSAAVMLHNYPCDIAFIDPPYEQENEYADSMNALAGTHAKLVIAQHPSRILLAENFGRLNKVRVLRQGDNSLSFYE